jgi:hypothetical protein
MALRVHSGEYAADPMEGLAELCIARAAEPRLAPVGQGQLETSQLLEQGAECLRTLGVQESGRQRQCDELVVRDDAIEAKSRGELLLESVPELDQREQPRRAR